jgi:hypothetical protein
MGAPPQAVRTLSAPGSAPPIQPEYRVDIRCLLRHNDLLATNAASRYRPSSSISSSASLTRAQKFRRLTSPARVARRNDLALERFFEADAIVPEPGNPQGAEPVAVKQSALTSESQAGAVCSVFTVPSSQLRSLRGLVFSSNPLSEEVAVRLNGLAHRACVLDYPLVPEPGQMQLGRVHQLRRPG